MHVTGRARCRKCARESTLVRHFRAQLCPACQPVEYGWPESIGIIGWACAFGFLLVMGLAAPRPVTLLLWFYAVGVLMCVLHELAHAFAAWLVGWHVHYVGIGSGRLWRRWRIRGLVVNIHRHPWTGAGFCGTRPKGRYSRAAAATVLAAPLVLHAAAAAATLPWFGTEAPLVTIFGAANLIDLVSSAWPREVRSVGRPNASVPPLATDGKLLLDLWRDPSGERRRWHVGRWVMPVYDRMLDGDADGAVAAAASALEAEPVDPDIRAMYAAAMVFSGKYEAALPFVSEMAAVSEQALPHGLDSGQLAAQGMFRGAELVQYLRGSLHVGADQLDLALAISERGVEGASSEEALALWRGCVALALTMAGKEPGRADEAARWAYERLPWVPLVETAWGMARIEHGDFKEGLAAFERARGADRRGSTRWLRAAWGAVAGRRDDVKALEEPGAWPACRRRASR